MLKNSFTSTERSRNTVCTTLRNWVECIDQTYLSNHWFSWSKTFCITVNSTFYRPFKCHLKFVIISFFICNNSNSIFDCITSCRSYRFYCVHSKFIKWNKDFVCKRSFWHSTYIVPSYNFITRFCSWCPFPFFISWK